MTGIERLRELIKGNGPGRYIVVPAVYGSYQDGYVAGVRDICDKLSIIYDQIRSDLDHERDRWDSELYEAQMDKTHVMAVYMEMERLLSGQELRGNNSIYRWARELRDALKSDTSDSADAQKTSCADPDGTADVTSEAAKVTRDPAADVSMSAYDLLPQDERDAIAWVCEHGGLSHVKDIYHDLRAVVERLGIEWSESELHGLMDALDRLLMTDDALRGTIEETCARLGVEHTGDLTQDAQAIWREIGVLRSRLKESVPRAAYERHLARLQRQIDESHAALRRRNARIAELERQRSEAVSAQLASDAALYDLRREVRDQCQAFGVDVGGCETASEMLHDMNEELSFRLMPEGMEWPRFEDGEPVRFGDMALIDGEADMVEAVQLWIHGKPVIYGDGGSQQLDKGERVKRPEIDSWERLEEDASKGACEYFGSKYCDCSTCKRLERSVKDCGTAKARDLVRRAKALAGGA